MFEQIFLSPQVKRSVIISNYWYVLVASPVVEQLKTWKTKKVQENVETAQNYYTEPSRKQP